LIEIPVGVRIIELHPKDLPGWDSPDYTVSRGFGDRWLSEAKTALVCVPSITGRPHESNYIINPDHQDASDLELAKTHAVVGDERLITKQ
jgi:RES domain-containing protein